jgi:phosphoserine phosphatase
MRAPVCRGAVAQITVRLTGASRGRMARIRDQVSTLCCGWPADVVAQIVTDGLRRIIAPHVSSSARSLLARHQQNGHDVIIVSTSGQEIVGPIGAMLGATEVIPTRLAVALGTSVRREPRPHCAGWRGPVSGPSSRSGGPGMADLPGRAACRTADRDAVA